MREKMIAIAGRLRARAQAQMGDPGARVLVWIAEEIEEELGAPQPAVADNLCPDCGKPRGYSEICFNKHHSMSSVGSFVSTGVGLGLAIDDIE